ncbi:cupin domain-containing protein [Tsukamurella ocularis]|uniref:cupin domain-containing protein n=1 Tax=Tsukamurella ocularis TaxID=1970234 RepID=UPI0021684FFD|nr:cupin domain-containing protein [Tsukamurella ocularis]MCS3778847.1 quercetin dioxygenase-like cupin family protein [Tsukamurella ocularis]MCS3787533.1 quercetin dioxygenase-like cupin family protein [Tsukamurella ocularis]MCS3851530.1 quercetin dioxygenase-like cupin family protein [Tsukamurella ocularis]
MSAGWAEVDGLAAGTPKAGDAPDVKLRQRTDAARIIQITFAAGQSMPGHSAPRPIVLLGQRGTVTVEIDGDVVVLESGRAVQLDERVPHSLTAVTDADVTLILVG